MYFSSEIKNVLLLIIIIIIIIIIVISIIIIIMVIKTQIFTFLQQSPKLHFQFTATWTPEVSDIHSLSFTCYCK